MSAWPPPKVGPLPPPPMPLWAPRSRGWLQRGLTRMDRRKARRWAEINLSYMDHAWITGYRTWWDQTGWMEGAPHPDKAWQNMINQRRGRAT